MAITRQNLTLNTFYKGIQQDDIVGSSFGVIESKNIDWLRTWYWATLWPKTTKQLLTSTTAMRTLESRNWSWDTGEAYAAWDWGNIYRLDATDSTPTFTLTWGEDIQAWQHFSTAIKYYFMKETSNNFFSLCSVPSNEADLDNWTNLIENVKTTMYSPNSPAMYANTSFLYVWYSNSVLQIDSAWVQTIFAIFNPAVNGITQHWTQFYIYSSNWMLSLWDWVSNSVSANINLWFRVRRVISKAWLDYITTETWDVYIVSWYSSQLFSEYKQSNRLNDNSQYIKKLDFKTDIYDNKTLAFTWNDLMLISNETQAWIYKYWDLIPWIQKGFHKITTEDNTWTNLDNIYTMVYEEALNTLYFSYKQGSIYWIDKLELDNLTTSQDWYIVTQIFRWPPNKVAKIERIRCTTSYTNWDNYIKLYKRINNASSWTLFYTINDDTNIIERHDISSEVDDFIDIQFKMEIHNDLQTNLPPILHWFELTYTITEENG